MTDDLKRLYAAVVHNPADHTPRLIYADCADEQEGPEAPAHRLHAELIRIQVKSATMGPCAYCHGTGRRHKTPRRGGEPLPFKPKGHPCRQCGRGEIVERCEAIHATRVPRVVIGASIIFDDVNTVIKNAPGPSPRMVLTDKTMSFNEWLGLMVPNHLVGIVSGGDVRCGFIDAVSIGIVPYLRNADDLFNWLPLSRVYISDRHPYNPNRVRASRPYETGASGEPIVHVVTYGDGGTYGFIGRVLGWVFPRDGIEDAIARRDPGFVIPQVLWKHIDKYADKTRAEKREDSRLWLEWATLVHGRDVAHLNYVDPRTLNPRPLATAPETV